jgi:hypothetical protein
LAASIPKSGGGCAFVREIFADFSSFIMGWMLWFGYMIAGGLYALGFAPNFLELSHAYEIVPAPDEVGAVALPLIDVSVPHDFEAKGSNCRASRRPSDRAGSSHQYRQ